MPNFPYSRTLPFFFYLLFLGVAQWLGSAQHAGHAWVAGWDLRWLYPIKVVLVGGMLSWFRHSYMELGPFAAIPLRHWLASVSIGFAVFLLWINLDHGWVVLGSAGGFNPSRTDGSTDWFLAIPRLLGAAIVVPLMEELFWRSFLMRWLDRQDFSALSPGKVSLQAYLLTSVLFGFEHHQWFAGILAGLAYGGLYMRTGNLWMPIVAHGVTNALLGIWVLQTGNWQFW